MKLNIKYLVAMLFTALIVQSGLAALPASLPGFKSKEELVKTTQQLRPTKAGEVQEASFYTGKPYEKAREGYLFKYRNYDPRLNRWTCADPSGFPDYANNHSYLTSPLDSIDILGLTITKVVSGITAENFLPCYATYNYSNMGADDVYSIAGTELNSLHQGSDPDWDNSCALRMDLALYDYGNRYNQNTPGVYPGTLNGNYGSYYIVAASGMKTYLNSTGSGFGSDQSDRTLAAGASDVDTLIQDLKDLSAQTGREAVALVVGNWHVAVVTSSGYVDPHISGHDWSSTDAPKVWVLE